MSVAFIRHTRFEKEVESLAGWLVPASERIPDTCLNETNGIPRDAMRLYLGGSLFYATTFPHTVIAVDGEPKLTIDKNSSGQIAVSVDVFGPDDRLIASLDKNNFVVNQNNHLDMRRTDLSTLEVLDQYKRSVLWVHFVNPSAIKLQALLYYPTHNPIAIKENEIQIGRRQYGHLCGITILDG